MIKNKKGMEQVNSLVWSLVMIGIFLGIGLLLLGKFQLQTYERTDSTDVVNETTTAVVNTTGTNLAVSSYYGVRCSVTDCINGTGSVHIPTSNWTATNCAVASTADSAFINEVWNCTYSYTYEESTTATEAINETINATADIPGWLPIIVIIVIASIILFYVFVMRRQTS